MLISVLISIFLWLVLIWLIGAILALIEMWIVNLFNISRYPKYIPYVAKEYFIGFIGSWYTLYVITNEWIEDTF